jgi:hypothetical protein
VFKRPGDPADIPHVTRPMLQLVKTNDESPASEPVFNRRRFERFSLPVGYTTITVQRTDAEAVTLLTGHAYDISEAGIRFELDEPLQLGERISASIMLACESEAVLVSATVVWLNDTLDDPGPRRMALNFESFASMADRNRLVNYLSRGQLARAA